jgi:antitoxin VapB
MNAPIHTKTFKSGNSEAVRLPKGMGFGIGTEVMAERHGDRIILTPAHDPSVKRKKLLDMLDALRALPKPSRIQKRDPIIFPDRPGL